MDGAVHSSYRLVPCTGVVDAVQFDEKHGRPAAAPCTQFASTFLF